MTARGSSRLDAGLDLLWARIDAAAQNPALPLRRLIVATGGAAGVDARVMVLRGCDRATATLAFYTDFRAPKIAVLAADPRVAVIGYDHDAAYQLRLRGTARIETAGPAWQAAHDSLRDADRRNYMTVGAPGTELPVAGDGQPAVPDPAAVARNFVRLVIVLDRVEWLDLSRNGHRRAVYDRTGAGWSGRWLTP